MDLLKEGADGLPEDGFDWIALKFIFQGKKGNNRSNLGICYFWQFYQKQSDKIFIYFEYSFWGSYWSTVKRWILIELF